MMCQSCQTSRTRHARRRGRRSESRTGRDQERTWEKAGQASRAHDDGHRAPHPARARHAAPNLTGVSVFDQGTGGFAFHPAHPFANGSSQAIFRLADELCIFNVETDRLPSLSTDQRARYLALPQDLPAQVTSLVEQGTQDRAALSSFNEVMREEAAMAWLARWFETGGFTYPLDAPDGDGTNNLEAIGDFLDRRSGYRVHCITSLAVPGRARGAPTRAAIGYRSSEIPAGTAATTSAAAETAASSTEMTNTPQKEAITTQETPEMSATPAPPPNQEVSVPPLAHHPPEPLGHMSQKYYLAIPCGGSLLFRGQTVPTACAGPARPSRRQPVAPSPRRCAHGEQSQY